MESALLERVSDCVLSLQQSYSFDSRYLLNSVLGPHGADVFHPLHVCILRLGAHPEALAVLEERVWRPETRCGVCSGIHRPSPRPIVCKREHVFLPCSLHGVHCLRRVYVISLGTGKKS